MSYRSTTFDSPNPLVRFAHRRRLSTALGMVEAWPGVRLLDFGCGDGLFLQALAEHLGENAVLVGYEPYMEVTAGKGVMVFDDWAEAREIFSGEAKADIVTCFEVMEHLTTEAQRRHLAEIGDVLTDDGHLIVSVPVECGIPSLVKNSLRAYRARKRKNDVYTLRNITRSLFELPIPECRNGQDYLPHMGFYFRDLENLIRERFTIQRRVTSPIAFAGAQFNSQVFYRLGKTIGNAHAVTRQESVSA